MFQQGRRQAAGIGEQGRGQTPGVKSRTMGRVVYREMCREQESSSPRKREGEGVKKVIH